LWKKKYFAEKKKTAPLEDRVNELLGEIDTNHKRIYNAIESDIKNAAIGGYREESQAKVYLDFIHSSIAIANLINHEIQIDLKE
jgi:hypothetical protein